MTRSRRAGARDDSGFTLFELLATMSLAVVVLFAVLQFADTFASGTSSRERVTDGEDAARTQVAQLVRRLRTATPVGTDGAIQRAGANDLVFSAADTLAASTVAESNTRYWARYCLDTSAGAGRGRLLVGRLDGSYVAPPATCTTASTGGWTYQVVTTASLANTATATPTATDPGSLFTYDNASSPQDSGRVGVSLALGVNRATPIRLTSAATLRSGSRSGLTAATVGTLVWTCDAARTVQSVSATYTKPSGGTTTANQDASGRPIRVLTYDPATSGNASPTPVALSTLHGAQAITAASTVFVRLQDVFGTTTTGTTVTVTCA